MKKIRINNDIDIVVEMKNEAGEVMQSQSLKNIAVVLSTGLKKHKVEDFTLLSNGVGFRFRASEQARTGVYDISVTAETADGRTFATDVCKAFELVACSCEAGGEAGEVEVESVSVTATFAITAFAGAGGGVTVETDPVFSASPAAKITDKDIAEWSNKQDAIADLAEIREGAKKGATALQEHQDISGKQDKLVSGENIKTINGESLLGIGNIKIESIAIGKHFILYQDTDTIIINDLTSPIGASEIISSNTDELGHIAMSFLDTQDGVVLGGVIVDIDYTYFIECNRDDDSGEITGNVVEKIPTKSQVYATKEELNNAIAEAITTALNTEV